MLICAHHSAKFEKIDPSIGHYIEEMGENAKKYLEFIEENKPKEIFSQLRFNYRYDRAPFIRQTRERLDSRDSL